MSKYQRRKLLKLCRPIAMLVAKPVHPRADRIQLTASNIPRVILSKCYCHITVKQNFSFMKVFWHLYRFLYYIFVCVRHNWQKSPFWAIAFLRWSQLTCIFRRELEYPVFTSLDFATLIILQSKILSLVMTISSINNNLKFKNINF
jgi:hypothetical protein